MLTPCALSKRTVNLLTYQKNFYENAKEAPGFSGVVKRELLGRIITIGISCYIHAEALLKIVVNAFRSIQQTISRSENQEWKKENVEWKETYRVSICLISAAIKGNVLVFVWVSHKDAGAHPIKPEDLGLLCANCRKKLSTEDFQDTSSEQEEGKITISHRNPQGSKLEEERKLRLSFLKRGDSTDETAQQSEIEGLFDGVESESSQNLSHGSEPSSSSAVSLEPPSSSGGSSKTEPGAQGSGSSERSYVVVTEPGLSASWEVVEEKDPE